MADFITEILNAENIKSDFDGILSQGVMAHGRTDGTNTYLFVENLNGFSVCLKTEKQFINLETNEIITK